VVNTVPYRIQYCTFVKQGEGRAERGEGDFYVVTNAGDPDPSIIKQISKKKFFSYCFVTSLYFLSEKNDVNVTSKSNKQKNFHC
jgi:hypothetical protein